MSVINDLIDSVNGHCHCKLVLLCNKFWRKSSIYQLLFVTLR